MNASPGESYEVVVQQSGGGQGCIITLLYFLVIGWWLSALWSAVAWFLVATIIGMPLGLIMINRLPMVATLREPTREFTAVTSGVSTQIVEGGLPQRNFFLRALYFLLIGIWFSGLWMSVAWFFAITLVGLPVAIWMYNRVPAVTTLKRY